MLSAGDEGQYQEANHGFFFKLDKSLWKYESLDNLSLQGWTSPDQTAGKDQLLNVLYPQSTGSGLVIRSHIFKGCPEQGPDCQVLQGDIPDPATMTQRTSPKATDSLP